MDDDLYWDKIQPIFVDDEGNVIFFNSENSLFFINGVNHLKDLKRRLADKGLNLENIDILKFGQGVMVAKFGSDIMMLKYNENGVTSSKLIKHKAVNIEDQCELEALIIPKNPRYLIIIYELSEVRTIIVWDTESNMEHTNFLGRKEDTFNDYIMGKNSMLGFM